MRIKNTEDDFLEEDMSISQQVTPGVVLLFGYIDDKSAANIVSWIIEANLSSTPHKELRLVINSPGGSVHSAFAIIEAMRGSRIPIATVGLGQICSAGLLIFMNGEKGRRYLTETCTVMSHQFSTAMGGTYHELINTKKELDFTHKRMIDCYARCTGKTEQYILKNMLSPHDSWLSPNDAVKHKMADMIIKPQNIVV